MDASSLYFLARKLKGLALASMATVAPSRPLAHAVVLAEAAKQPGVTIGEIAGRHALAQSLVSTAVLALQAAGAVRASPDPSDRRRTIIELQSGVSGRAGDPLPQSGDALAATLARLTQRDQKSVVRGLFLLEKALRQEPPRKRATSRRQDSASE